MAVLLLLPVSFSEGQTARFVERSSDLGIDFRHRHFGTGEKYMPETQGSGVAIVDVDGDGLLDVYFVQSAPLGDTAGLAPANRLYRQTANGSFVDATEGSGAQDVGVGMGVAYGDIDNDGDPDLYLTNFGRNTLLRNRGDGTFEDTTSEAGVGGDLWSTAAGFFDGDGDGDLDLYVVNYVNFSADNHKWCGNAQHQIRSYCHPDVYTGLGDTLYRNDGDGTFTDISQEADLRRTGEAKGLGVAIADLDQDHILDIYVANDSTRNHFYKGLGGLRYREAGLLSGTAFNASGAAEASMGVAVDDLDSDGLPDLFLTHLSDETNTLYTNLGEGLFRDATAASGLGQPSLPWVGFGTVIVDHDNDGDPDLLVANGNVVHNIELYDPDASFRQPAQLFDNVGGGRFADLTRELGFAERLVGRGMATGDLDRDGDADFVITQNDGPALVLINQVGSQRSSISLRLEGKESNPHGWGAVVTVQSGQTRQVRIAQGSSSYLSQSAPDLHFGLADHTGAVSVEVRWPSGRVDRHPTLEPGAVHSLTEGSAQTSSDKYR